MFKFKKHWKKITILSLSSIFASLSLSSCFEIISSDQAYQSINLGDRQSFADKQDYSIETLAKKLLKLPDSRNQIVEVFTNELIYNWYKKIKEDKIQNPTTFPRILDSFVDDWDDAHRAADEAYNNVIRRLNGDLNNLSIQNLLQRSELDKNNGSIESFKKNHIINALFNSFQAAIFNLKRTTFTYNPNAEFENGTNNKLKMNEKAFANLQQPLKADDLNDNNNWSKFQFYPILDQNSYNEKTKTKAEKFAYSIADVSNYMYDHWMEITTPFNVHMALWKYDPNAKQSTLRNIYNNEKLGTNFPASADYKFPYFNDEQNAEQETTTSKFNQFITNLDSFTLDNQLVHIPVAYTEDSSTQIYVKANSIFSELFPQFAAASVHKYLQLISGSDLITNNSELVKSVNKIKYDDIKSKNLIDLFLANSGETNNIGIKINKELWNTTNSLYKDKEFVMDQRDLVDSSDNDKGWIFLRNVAGVHAISIDGYDYIKNGPKKSNGNVVQSSTTTTNKDQLKKRAKEVFNFRILQANNSSLAGIENAFKDFDPFADLNTYINNNNRLLTLNYFLDKKNDEQSFFKGVEDPTISVLGELQKDFVNSIAYLDNSNTSTNLTNLQSEFEKLLKIVTQMQVNDSNLDLLSNMRNKLQSEYSTLNLSTTKKDNNIFPAFANGLASALPYKPNIDFTKAIGKDNDANYPTLVGIYNDDKINKFTSLIFANNQKSSNSNGDSDQKVSSWQKLNDEYKSVIDSLFTKFKIAPATNITYPSGNQEILTNSNLINHVFKNFFNLNNGLSNMLLIDHITNDYLKDLFDPTTNLVKKTEQLGDTYKAIGDNSSKLDITKALKNTYYAKTFLESTNPNLYGGFKTYSKSNDSITSESLESFSGSYLRKQEEIFQNQFYNLTSNGYDLYSTSNVNYLDYLSAIQYLVKDNYINLRNYLATALNNRSQAAFVWTKAVPNIENITDNENIYSAFEKQSGFNWKKQYYNPYINPDLSFSEDTFIINEPSSFVYTKAAKTFNGSDTTTSFDKTYLGFQGLVIQNATNTWNNASDASFISTVLNNIKDYTNSSSNGILFNFGKRDDLFNFIRNESPSRITEFARTLANEITNLNIAPVTSDVVRVTLSNGSTIDHNLLIEEKQNALLALVYNYKMPTINTNTPISSADYKKIYGTDPEQNFNRINNFRNQLMLKTSGDDYQDNIKDALFQRLTGPISSSLNNTANGNKYFFNHVQNEQKWISMMIQVSLNDVNSATNFTSFIKTYLGDDAFAIWLAQLASEQFFQQLAKADVERTLPRISVFDARWRDNLTDKYIK